MTIETEEITTATDKGTTTATAPAPDTILIRKINKSGEEPTDDEIEWTTAKLVDELAYHLCTYTEGLDNNGDVALTRPYYKQAEHLMPRIPVWIQERFGAAPPFEIKKSTLTPELKKRIAEFKRDSYDWVFNEALVNAVGKLFENLDKKRYHRSVKGLLTVVFV
ncbi:MAG: hypothetical protein ACHQ1D_03265 [Nitrososphaerales archaeon]